jgi:hypothetical protein
MCRFQQIPKGVHGTKNVKNPCHVLIKQFRQNSVFLNLWCFLDVKLRRKGVFYNTEFNFYFYL